MAKLSSEAVGALKERIDAVTADPEGIPGVVYCAVNKGGDLLFEHASGKVGVGQERDMDMNTVFWIASCTKMITGIACMQLVEQGRLELDSVELVEKLAPELKEVKVLEEEGKLVERKRGITLRMLLTHTAGFGYSSFNKKLNDYYTPIGLDEMSGMEEEYLSQPLVNQPGDRWEYGINIDWAGQLVERVTGMSLNDYFLMHIFEPMGIKSISMFPTTQMKKDLAFLNIRDRDGKLSLNMNGHLYRRPLVVTKPEDIKAAFNAGGGGCFARPAEYCQIIAMLLNDGTHAKTGNQILKPETVKEMFTNQIKDMPDFWPPGHLLSQTTAIKLFPGSLPTATRTSAGLGTSRGPMGRAPGAPLTGGVPPL